MKATQPIEPEKFGKVAVLLGGLSAEREVSLNSGNAVFQALKRQNIDAEAIDVGVDIVAQLQALKPDRAFIALHGPGGEDGVIQGLLEWLQIPYTGSGVGASAIAMDKPRAKWVWQANGLPTLPFILLNEKSSSESDIEKLQNIPFNYPYCVKPIGEGSSNGVTRVNQADQLEAAIVAAAQYNSPIMIEPWIEGKELTVGILAQEPLPPIEIQVAEAFYDYKAKYLVNSTNYICPCDLSLERSHELQQLALQAFQLLGCRHWGRVDIMMDKQGKFWLLEVNTIPGLTDHSLVPKAANVTGLNFDDLIVTILAQTL
ncbi:D-alanine--D-alanine ligase [soil metagenome]